MLLDFDAATLTVFVNGERKGVMVQPGMALGNYSLDRNWDDEPAGQEGQPVARLEGPLRWAVDVADSVVEVDGPKPPPA